MKDFEAILKYLKSKTITRRFDQLSQKECSDYYEIVMLNSKEHLEISSILSDKQKFGSAIVHLIFGAEEMTKALILFINGKGINLSNINGFRGMFYKHKPRHNFAHFIQVFYFIMKSFHDFFKQVKDMENPESFDNDSFFENYKDDFKQIADNFWWFEADALKNKGLYVDYSNKIITPSSLKEDDFKEAGKNVLEYCAFCTELIKTIENLNESELDVIINLCKTEKFKQTISILFDDKKIN